MVTMVTHTGLTTIKISPRLKKRGRSIDAELIVVGNVRIMASLYFVMKKMHTEKLRVSTSLHSLLIGKLLSYFEMA